jgi:hypothetical protein
MAHERALITDCSGARDLAMFEILREQRIEELETAIILDDHLPSVPGHHLAYFKRRAFSAEGARKRTRLLHADLKSNAVG